MVVTHSPSGCSSVMRSGCSVVAFGDDQRRLTLHSEDPALLGWVAQPLAKLGAAVAAAGA
jgi:hypothetical protein